MSSDDDGDSRKGRRSNKSEEDYEDVNDCYDPQEADTSGGGGSVSGSDGDDSIDMNSDDGANMKRAHRGPATMRIKSPASRSSTHHKERQVGATVNPDNLVRTREKGPLAGETLYQFHRRCLLRYQQIHGDMLVNITFIVPWSNEWACEMWDMKLGILVMNIRSSCRYMNEDLAALGFDYSAQRKENFKWDVFKFALQTYKSIHGDLLVPKLFLIPRDSTMWPETIWGMKLGIILDNAKKKDSLHSEKLREMGVVIRK